MSSDVIEFECPRCLKTIRVGKEQAGTRVDCPGCSGSLLVPTQNTGQDLFDDIFDSTPMPPPTSKSKSKSTSNPTDDSAPADPLSKLRTEASNQTLESPDLEIVEDDQDLLAGLEIPSSDDALIPLDGEDPFKVDPDAPLKIDGVGDMFSHDDVFGIKCNICDTRIHVRPEQIGNEVECPECYSKIKVSSPEQKSAMRWEKDGRGRHQKRKKEEEELKLSAPIERPKVEIDESFGLAPVEDDLLAPKAPDERELKTSDSPKRKRGAVDVNDIPALEVVEDDIPALEIIEDDDPFEELGSAPIVAPVSTRSGQSENPSATPANKSSPTPGKRKRRKSRRELYEDSQDLQAEEERGTVRRTRAAKKKGKTTSFPDFQFRDLIASSIEMIKSPGVLFRTAIAFGLMCFGALAMEYCFPFSFQDGPRGSAEWTFVERILAWLKWTVFGGIPYLAGLGFLWWICSHIFRDAALGNRTVASWKNAGKSEWLATFSIFAFGFFMGGFPSFFFSPLVMPFRFLLGPLFLVAAWYNESPFQIVSVDAFGSAKKNVKHWTQFYSLMSALAMIGLVNGFFFWFRAGVPYFILDAIILVLGITVNVAITLVFASVCGWHCGTVAEQLENE